MLRHKKNTALTGRLRGTLQCEFSKGRVTQVSYDSYVLESSFLSANLFLLCPEAARESVYTGTK